MLGAVWPLIWKTSESFFPPTGIYFALSFIFELMTSNLGLKWVYEDRPYSRNLFLIYLILIQGIYRTCKKYQKVGYCGLIKRDDLIISKRHSDVSNSTTVTRAINYRLYSRNPGWTFPSFSSWARNPWGNQRNGHWQKLEGPVRVLGFAVAAKRNELNLVHGPVCYGANGSA